MSEPSADLILEYDTWRVGDTWHARRRAQVTDEQAAHGVQEIVTAESFDDLEVECFGQRIRASWCA